LQYCNVLQSADFFILPMSFSGPLSLWRSFTESYLLERVPTRAHTHPTTHAHTHKRARARAHTHTLIRRQTHTPSLCHIQTPTHPPTQTYSHTHAMQMRAFASTALETEEHVRPHTPTQYTCVRSFVWAERAQLLYCVRRRVWVDVQIPFIPIPYPPTHAYTRNADVPAIHMRAETAHAQSTDAHIRSRGAEAPT